LPRNKYPEETIKIILDAALKVFLEKGYEKTTILDIVGEMKGLTRGAFYHHFKSKEAVLHALDNQLFDAIDPFERVKSMTHLNGMGKLKWVMNEMISNDDFKKLQLQMIPLMSSPTFMKKVIDESRDFFAPRYAEIIEAGIKDGSIKAKHPQLTAEVMLLLLDIWMAPCIYPQIDMDTALKRYEMMKDIFGFLGLEVFDIIEDINTYAIMDDDGLVKEVSKEEAEEIISKL
jgi:AcrR family transcriptional regulator